MSRGSNDVSVIDTAMNTVAPTPIPVGSLPVGVAINPDANRSSNTVSAIDTAMNTVVWTPIPVGTIPEGVAGRNVVVARL